MQDKSPKPATYREELTPEGIQLVIPGCERKEPPAKAGDKPRKPVQTSLFD